MNKNEVFAKGFCFDKLFWIFVIGCVFGAYYEELLVLIKGLIHQGIPIMEYRQVLFMDLLVRFMVLGQY